MSVLEIKTLGQLKDSGYVSKSIKNELRDNLISKLKANEEVFEGVIGYENTVVPELQRAILSKHNINLLGLRGQAKTRLARLMINLLDEYIPFVEGSEINDDPLKPISRYALDLLAEKGEKTPISWLHRSERFSEKLATPDVTVADLIGDVDPIKAANLKLSYADDRVIHFGMIPRANRCLFVINELPDLQARIQVALFNILQEGDMQIRGYKLRLPLDIQFVFTANPEDYTNRGSIVTPLKDRIGSQILTHYPESIAIAKSITKQEARLEKIQLEKIKIPEIAYDLIEQIGFEARESEFIDAKSGVSARMSITALESLVSAAELRLLENGEENTQIRLTDFMGIVPAITGKVELVYEGEQEGAQGVALTLLHQAIKSIFLNYFPKIEKLEKPEAKNPYSELINWFIEGNEVELLDDMSDEDYKEELKSILPLSNLIQKYADVHVGTEEENMLKEILLWGLAEHKKLSKSRFVNGFSFKDIYGNLLKGLN